ncbi:hypothetical protein B296_00039783 [Ensete ventricosum]|uniref:Uncharacterized protein n=1 Tax=Ensete ventricosum TaxID=4639 RepID=A0A426YAD9_ENSVE|nr:hypothetical protein B296_00039783 [Ensete ventricosum]
MRVSNGHVCCNKSVDVIHHTIVDNNEEVLGRGAWRKGRSIGADQVAMAASALVEFSKSWGRAKGLSLEGRAPRLPWEGKNLLTMKQQRLQFCQYRWLEKGPEGANRGGSRRTEDTMLATPRLRRRQLWEDGGYNDDSARELGIIVDGYHWRRRRHRL